jgi:cold shock protein
MNKEQGAVKWFNEAKGYGFIQRDQTRSDIFVHYSAIVSNGYKTLREGQRVEFSVQDTPKGPQATEVKPL